MGTPRRVGFVGAGDLAPVHVEAVQALTGVLAVGVHDIEAPRATSLADRYGLRAAATMEELVGLGVDVVHVITPPETHAELAIGAMELGCDVFIEKPMALSVEDCERVVATSRRTGRTATVDHLMLFNPQVRRAVELVRRGTIGRVVAVDVLRGGETPEYRGGTLPPFFRRAGHPFRDLGIHCLTVIEAFLGPITDVRASWQSLGGEPSIAFDEWRATVTCRDGLALGRNADQTLAILVERNDRWGGAISFRVGNHSRISTFHHCDDAVGGTQVNANNFSHNKLSLQYISGKPACSQ